MAQDRLNSLAIAVARTDMLDVVDKLLPVWTTRAGSSMDVFQSSRPLAQYFERRIS